MHAYGRAALTSVLLLALGIIQTGPAFAQGANPDGIPQVSAAQERHAYDESTDALLTYFWPLMYEIDALPDPPTPEQVKASPIRKLILDYRIVMDVHAYSYEPGLFEAYRDALDLAYEEVGQYKDLFDIQDVDGLPINETVAKIRLARMDFALAALRLGSFREDMKEFAYSRVPGGTTFAQKEIPRLWQLAGTTPRADLDNAGNAAALGQGVLRWLIADGMIVGDILDEEQEAHFHNVRKALRSVLVISDMYPSIAEEVAKERVPLAKLVSAYGKVNDRFVAYRLALASGINVDERLKDLLDAHETSKSQVRDALSTGTIQAYIDALGVSVASHPR
jgi:hypothetical protein